MDWLIIYLGIGILVYLLANKSQNDLGGWRFTALLLTFLAWPVPIFMIICVILFRPDLLKVAREDYLAKRNIVINKKLEYILERLDYLKYELSNPNIKTENPCLFAALKLEYEILLKELKELKQEINTYRSRP